MGESLVGDGNEVAHIDLLIGSKGGPVGEAFANALVNQKEGHTNLLAVVAPNLPAKPDTIMSNKVTIKGATQAVQMFGPAQAAVARAVVDSVREGVIPEDQVDDLCIIVGVFIHWEATDDKKIFDYNYQATKESIARALDGEPTSSTVLDGDGRRAAPVRRAPRADGHGGPIDRTGPARRLDGLRTVVTGASSGIGARDRRGVRRRRRHRARDVPRSPERAQRVADAIAAQGGRALVARPTSARATAARPRRRGARRARRPRRLGQQRRRRRAHRRGGGVGLGAQARPAARRRPQGHDRLLVRGRRGHARQQRGGAIVNMSWDHVDERHGRREPGAVRAVKGGVLAFSKSLARALAPAVRVNVLCPGWIETAFGEQADPEFRRVGRGGHAAGALGDAGRTSPRGALSGLAGGGVRHRAGDQRQRRRVML